MAGRAGIGRGSARRSGRVLSEILVPDLAQDLVLAHTLPEPLLYDGSRAIGPDSERSVGRSNGGNVFVSMTGPEPKVEEKFTRRMLPALLVLFFFDGFSQMINAGAAAFYREDFGLTEPELVRVFAYVSLGAIGTLVLGRLMDWVGRRRILLVGIAGTAAASMTVAMSGSLALFVMAQILKFAFAGTVYSAANTFMTEELETEARPRGQAAGGIAIQIGSGAALVGVALVVDLPGGWRWAFVFLALPVLALPWIRGVFRETKRFADAAARGESDRARARELFSSKYRARTSGVLTAVFLANATVVVSMTWLIYHAETALGMSPGVATAIVVGGGAVGLAGFPLGAYSANRFGRRVTVLVFGLSLAAGNVAYYWVPAGPPVQTAFALGLLFSTASIGFGGATVAMRTASQEMFPTRLRGTVSGVGLAVAAVSGVVSHLATSVLAEALGSLVPAITILTIVGASGFVLYYVLLPETRGLSLEEASLEVESGGT